MYVSYPRKAVDGSSQNEKKSEQENTKSAMSRHRTTSRNHNINQPSNFNSLLFLSISYKKFAVSNIFVYGGFRNVWILFPVTNMSYLFRITSNRGHSNITCFSSSRTRHWVHTRSFLSVTGLVYRPVSIFKRWLDSRHREMMIR